MSHPADHDALVETLAEVWEDEPSAAELSLCEQMARNLIAAGWRPHPWLSDALSSVIPPPVGDEVQP